MATVSITQQSTATLVQEQTVSHNRALPHWYRNRQYHTTEGCHTGTGTHSITQQTLPQSYNESITYQSTATLVLPLRVSHNRALPHWYGHCQYQTTEHCHIGTGTDSITQQSTATLVWPLSVSNNRALPHWYRN